MTRTNSISFSLIYFSPDCRLKVGDQGLCQLSQMNFIHFMPQREIDKILNLS